MPHKVPSIVSRANPLTVKWSGPPTYRREHIIHGSTIKSKMRFWADRQDLRFWNMRRKAESREMDTFGYFPKVKGHGRDMEASREHQERILQLQTKPHDRIRFHNIHEGDWREENMDRHYKTEEVAGETVKVWQIYRVEKVVSSYAYLKAWNKPIEFEVPANYERMEQAEREEVDHNWRRHDENPDNQGIQPIHYSRLGLLITSPNVPPTRRIFARRLGRYNIRRNPLTGRLIWDRVALGIFPRTTWDKNRWDEDTRLGGEYTITDELLARYKINAREDLSILRGRYLDPHGRPVAPARGVRELAGIGRQEREAKTAQDEAKDGSRKDQTRNPRATETADVRSPSFRPAVSLDRDVRDVETFLAANTQYASLFPQTLRAPAPKDQTVSNQYILDTRSRASDSTEGSNSNENIKLRYPAAASLGGELQGDERSVVDVLMPLYLSEELAPRFAKNKVRGDWLANQRNRRAESDRYAQKEVDDWVLRGRDNHLRGALEDAWAGLPDAVLKPRSTAEIRLAAKEELAIALEDRQKDVKTLRRMGFKYSFERGEWVPGKKWARIVARRKMKQNRLRRKVQTMRALRVEEEKGMVVPESLKLGSKEVYAKRKWEATRARKVYLQTGKRPPGRQGTSSPDKLHGNRAKDLKYHVSE